MFFIKSWYDFLFIICTRYLLLASLGYFVWYVIRKKKLGYKKIQLKFPTSKDYKREIFFSLITTTIFATIGFLLLSKSMPIRQHTLIYNSVSDYSKLWFWLAFPIMFVLHDAYFYFTHRLMHHPKLFKIFHVLHHKSTNPSPWAAFSFHPLEALVEVGIVPILVFIMPLNPWHLFFFFLFQMVYNVYGHLGWELFPARFNKTFLGKYINTSVCHNQHHQYFKGNYGLYFLWWDRLFKTLRTDYDKQYKEVKSRSN